METAHTAVVIIRAAQHRQAGMRAALALQAAGTRVRFLSLEKTAPVDKEAPVTSVGSAFNTVRLHHFDTDTSDPSGFDRISLDEMAGMIATAHKVVAF